MEKYRRPWILMNLSRDYMLPPTWLTESGIVIAFSDFVDLYFVVIYYIDVVDKWWYCLDNSRVVQKIIKPTSFYRAMHTWDRMSSVCPAISLKRVKIEEKLLWRTYKNSLTLFRTVPSPTPYGLPFPKIWGSQPPPKTSIQHFGQIVADTEIICMEGL